MTVTMPKLSQSLVLLALATACATTATDPIVVTDMHGRPARPLADLAGARATVLLFISQDCPIANGYSPEIHAIRAEYAPKGVRFYLVHIDRDLTPEQARQHAAEYGHTGPVLLDSDRRLVAATGVTITPEAALFTSHGDLAYRGRIDNWYADLGRKRPRPTVRDLRGALDAVLAGKPVPAPRTQAVGCYIEDM